MDNKKIKKEKKKVEPKPLRQILLETDGIEVFVKKAETTSNIEFKAILQIVLSMLK